MNPYVDRFLVSAQQFKTNADTKKHILLDETSARFWKWIRKNLHFLRLRFEIGRIHCIIYDITGEKSHKFDVYTLFRMTSD